jgi:hypothetical protein
MVRNMSSSLTTGFFLLRRMTLVEVMSIRRYLPTSVQKSYFMLSRLPRTVLDTALRKYRPGRTDLIPVGGIAQLKPALRLMTSYRLVIQEVTGPRS